MEIKEIEINKTTPGALSRLRSFLLGLKSSSRAKKPVEPAKTSEDNVFDYAGNL